MLPWSQKVEKRKGGKSHAELLLTFCLEMTQHCCSHFIDELTWPCLNPRGSRWPSCWLPRMREANICEQHWCLPQPSMSFHLSLLLFHLVVFKLFFLSFCIFLTEFIIWYFSLLGFEGGLFSFFSNWSLLFV